MVLPSATEATAPTQEAPATRLSPASEVDLKTLAEKIYQLLKEEARIERERLGRHQPR